MTKFEAALIALDNIGSVQAADAKFAMQSAGATVEDITASNAAKAEQFRRLDKASSACNAEAYRAVADALSNLLEDKGPAAEMIFTVEQTVTGVLLFEGPAASADDALDRMAQAAGCADFASIPPEIGGGDTLAVRRVA